MKPTRSRRVPPDFVDQVEALRRSSLERIDKIPIAALIWGPSPSSGSPHGDIRLQLRDELARRGHLANFSEDLIDHSSNRSVFAQQLAQVESHDIVFSIPSSPGSTAEIHDFAQIPGVSYKIITFLDSSWNNGYSNQSLIHLQSPATCAIQLYNASELPDCVIEKSLALVARLQEVYYARGRRN